MVRKILWWVFWGMIVLLIVAWLLGGGISNIKRAASQNVGHPLSYLITHPIIMLPWSVPIPQGPDISNLTGEDQAGGNSGEPSQASTFGNPSPYANSLTISADGARASDPQSEYISIQNTGSTAIDVSGWSVQSAISGARSYIPRAASLFVLGALNAETDIDLAPGGTLTITTGSSPVGTSFRENECSGYLEQMQTFNPSLPPTCPNADTQAASSYGQACADFVSSLPACTFPRSAPSNVSSACQSYVQSTFSYNGCVQAHQNDSSFASDNWRAYFDASRELWSNTSDTIRLLDSDGRVVAVTSY